MPRQAPNQGCLSTVPTSREHVCRRPKKQTKLWFASLRGVRHVPRENCLSSILSSRATSSKFYVEHTRLNLEELTRIKDTSVRAPHHFPERSFLPRRRTKSQDMQMSEGCKTNYQATSFRTLDQVQERDFLIYVLLSSVSERR